MTPMVLFQSLWMFFLWLVFTSNLNSQTTWLKVKLQLVTFQLSCPRSTDTATQPNLPNHQLR